MSTDVEYWQYVIIWIVNSLMLLFCVLQSVRGGGASSWLFGQPIATWFDCDTLNIIAIFFFANDVQMFNAFSVFDIKNEVDCLFFIKPWETTDLSNDHPSSNHIIQMLCVIG